MSLLGYSSGRAAVSVDTPCRGGIRSLAMQWLADPDVWASFITLLALEIVLGIDTLVFVALLAGQLPARLRARARQIG
jgi:predicted tellurium resistance membrane protein TerC